MDGTEEARLLAEQTRSLAKRKRAQDDSPEFANKKSKPSTKLKTKSHPCTHRVALPPGYDESCNRFDPAVHGTLQDPVYDVKNYRKQYPFALDAFQSISVACLEREESVMVAAHTSAGKTVVAEYAIAKALQANQRVVYTSPLKALSNQKYRELDEEFSDVGLMTGDVSINPEASCVVMTTEILRSMLYRGSEMMREVAWVIFDEVHYMQDRERGVVWEETIINLPRAVRMVFLSATLSNAFEFAEWVASLHSQPCHVVYTDFRPTPLQHFALPCIVSERAADKGGLYMLCTQENEFKTMMWDHLLSAGLLKNNVDLLDSRESGNGKHRDAASDSNGLGKGGPEGGKKGQKPKRNVKHISERIVDVLRLAQQKNLLPIIVFSFARKECEQFAMGCWTAGEKDGGLDFTTDDEKEVIEQIFTNAIANLKEEDRELAAIKFMKRYLLRGIGVHHGGLIPLIKEVVELMFQESLVKVRQ